MNLSEIKEELIEKLKTTTETEILAGKLEKVFIPWFLEKTNSSDKNITTSLEELKTKISTNFNQFLISSEVRNSIDKYSESQKYFSDLNSGSALLDEVQKLIRWEDFRDYKSDYGVDQNDELKLSLSKLVSKFEPELNKVFDARSIERFCRKKKAEVSDEIESLKKSLEIQKGEIPNSYENIKNEKAIFFKNEENALRFFYRIFLNRNLENISTDILSFKIYIDRSYRQSQNEYSLPIYLKPEQQILPKNWRKHLSKILSEKIPNFSGKNNGRFVQDTIKLSSLDCSYLLALKSALHYQEEITTDDNEIFLALSGGMMAKIGFKEKASFIESFQQKETEIYQQKNSNRNYETLYSYVSIEYPNKWFLLTKEFVIEISFESAPILFGNASIAEVATAKQIEHNEEEERLAQESDDEEYDNRRGRSY